MDLNPNGSIEMFNGFTAKATIDRRGTIGGLQRDLDDDIVTIKIDVVGSRDSAFTELRLQSNAQDKEGHELGKAIYDVSLNAKQADGDDILIGGYGDDLIYGQAGNDILWGDLKDESNPDGSVGNDVFVFSMLKDNGNDIIKDFSIEHDKLYMIDLLDAYQGSGTYHPETNGHVTRYPGVNGDGDPQSTFKSDNNITLKDLVSSSEGGNNSQYITVTGNNENDVVLSLTGRGASKGSVTLENVKFGVNDNDSNTYGSVADLLGANGHKQILYVTTDSFNIDPNNDLTKLTNIDTTGLFGI